MNKSKSVSFLKVFVGTALVTLLFVTWGGNLLARLDDQMPYRLPATWLGWVLVVGALALIAYAEYTFLTHGGATGTPNDPPHRLVIGGPYRWTRNPLYLSGLAGLVGTALVLGSATVLIIALSAAPLFHLFIIQYEEPRLEQKYGEEYRAYKYTVPRWIIRNRLALSKPICLYMRSAICAKPDLSINWNSVRVMRINP